MVTMIMKEHINFLLNKIQEHITFFIFISTTECLALNDPANGMVTWTSLTTGGVTTYVCDSGFELVGDEMRDCQSNSQWSGEAPICRRKFVLCDFCVFSSFP